MERLKVSMITICYNAEKTIAKTIESVLSQDYENLESVSDNRGRYIHCGKVWLKSLQGYEI